MAEEELIEFTMSSSVEVTFSASDIARQLTRLGAVDLVSEIDNELRSWPATILLARIFDRALDRARQEVPHLVELTDGELEELMEEEDADEISRSEDEDGSDILPGEGA